MAKTSTETATFPRQGKVICDECGNKHEANYSHPGRFGEGPVFEVICDADGKGLSDYYLLERLV